MQWLSASVEEELGSCGGGGGGGSMFVVQEKSSDVQSNAANERKRQVFIGNSCLWWKI
jgi:hypothetical protein